MYKSVYFLLCAIRDLIFLQELLKYFKNLLKCLLFRKNLKIHFFSEKNVFFLQRAYRNPNDFQPKKGLLIKSYSISESAKNGLSPDVFNSISEILTKIHIFFGGGLQKP